MPWGVPDAQPAYCPGCGRVGLDFLERRRASSKGPAGVLWFRVCPRCWWAGWRLVGTGIEAGLFWWPRGEARGARRDQVA